MYHNGQRLGRNFIGVSSSSQEKLTYIKFSDNQSWSLRHLVLTSLASSIESDCLSDFILTPLALLI